MILFNMDTRELVSFDVVSEYLHRSYVDFWENVQIEFNEDVYNCIFEKINGSFRIMIESKEYLKITTVVKECFSNVFFYNSVYFCNCENKKNLTVKDLLSPVEVEFLMEKGQKFHDFILPSNVIFKCDFPKFFHVSEDTLLEIDFLVLGFLKKFFEKDNLDVNKKIEMTGGS